MNLRIYPYKTRSQSARELRDRLNAGRLVLPQGSYVYKDTDIILNWGNSTVPDWNHDDVEWLNAPVNVGLASNKRKAHAMFSRHGVPTLKTTTVKEQAELWQDNGHTVVERHLLQGHSGQGIVVKHPDEELSDVPLYSQYLGARREYRVHVFNNQVIYVQQKKRRNGARELPNYSDVIRNHGTGWVYCEDDITPLPLSAEEIAIDAVSALSLAFGAVDIATREGESYVIEVNTAPGLEGRSVEIYCDAISTYCNASILSGGNRMLAVM